MILAQIVTAAALDEHGILQLLLLQLQRHLVLLGAGVGLHDLHLLLLIIVGPTHLAPVGRLLVALSSYRALV